MGALDEGHFNLELENGIKLSKIQIGFEQEQETLAIQDAVKVLLQGLNEDINRDGIKKTPFRVAKALRDGTRGSFFPYFIHLLIYDIFINSTVILSKWAPSIITQ